MSELWMCDEREKKKEEEDKEGVEKKRELLPCRSFPPTKALPPSFSLRTSVSFQRESLFRPMLYNCCEDFEVPSFKKTRRRRTKVFSTTRKDDMTFSSATRWGRAQLICK
jgi:hypothetical protein